MTNLVVLPIVVPIIVGLIIMIWKEKVVVHKWATALTFIFLILLSINEKTIKHITKL